MAAIAKVALGSGGILVPAFMTLSSDLFMYYSHYYADTPKVANDNYFPAFTASLEPIPL